jgi:uncharacterized protein with FMN-binding domain
MRRAPIVLGATVAGTAGVLAFHPHSPAVQTTAAATPVAKAKATATAAASGSSGGGSATGDAVSTQYGDVQVRVTVSGGKITKVQALQLTGNDPRSAQISAYAEPILRQEALSKQTGAIDAVSGATYTSDGYIQSLQSALGKLGFKTA